MGAEQGTSSTPSYIHHMPFGAGGVWPGCQIPIHQRFSFSLLCSALLLRSKKQMPLGATILGVGGGKKDDANTSALFQIVHFLSPRTVRKQQAIKYRRAVLRRNK